MSKLNDNFSEANTGKKQQHLVQIEAREYQPTNGLITVREIDREKAFEKIAEALNSHPDITCDWIDGVAADS